MARTTLATQVPGDVLRASYLNAIKANDEDHETRVVALEGSGADVVGPSSAVDQELALFNGTTGKLLERATGTGYVKVTAGVMGTPAATVPLATDVSGNLPLANLPTNFAQILKATVTLTDAQIKALPTTAITLVAAPGASQRIEIATILLYGTLVAPYTNITATASYLVGRLGTDEMTSYIFNSTGTPVQATLTDLLAGTSPTWSELRNWQDVVSYVGGWGAVARVEQAAGYRTNAALNLFVDNAGGGNFTGGNAGNSLTATVTYQIVAVP